VTYGWVQNVDCDFVTFAESHDDEKRHFDKQDLDWEKDMELKSKFVDRKV